MDENVEWLIPLSAVEVRSVYWLLQREIAAIEGGQSQWQPYREFYEAVADRLKPLLPDRNNGGR